MVKSKHGDITLGKSEKHGFEDIVTLHAYVRPPSDPQFVGTEFAFGGVTDDDIARDGWIVMVETEKAQAPP